MKVSSFVDRGRAFDKFLIAILIYMIGGFPTLVYALPQGGTISSGAGTIDTSGSALTVTQTTNKIIINWESFSIGNNESVIFLQPDSSSSALNNVLGTSRTVVEGNLLANGQIVLSNPNGIFLSPNANIDVAGLIASTLKISEQDFLDGLYKFSQDSSKPLASILNEGKIRASDFAALIAPSVDNKGVVIANLGTVGLVSGKAATVDFVGDNLIKFTVNAPVEGQVLDKNGNLISDRISNSGSIQANGGQVILSAKNASSIIQDVINVEGLITAKTVTKKNGLIVISGGNQGNVNVAGTLDASGEKPGDQGGEITIEGATVTTYNASIQAEGTDAKGGDINITGTNWVSATGTIDASGKTGGNVNITTGDLDISAPILAKGTTGQGGNININTLFKSWEVVSAMLDVSGASGGSIKHFADQQIVTSGKYLAIGTAGKGGSIDVTANALKFLSNTIDASGTMGGGRIRLGGEYQGGKNLATDEITNARTLVMTDTAKVTAKAMGANGDGGRIITWADKKAIVLGQFDTTPGTQTGAGGFVEVSSGDVLNFGGNAKTGIGERLGKLLLDPKNIVITDVNAFSQSSIMLGYGYSGADVGVAGDIGEPDLANNTTNDKELFGQDVSLDGNRLAVGAPFMQTDGDDRTGTVYLYSFDDSNFSNGKLRATIGQNRTIHQYLDEAVHFGQSVSLDTAADGSARLAVGAKNYNGDTGSRQGAVFLYTFTGTNDLNNSFDGGSLVGKIGADTSLLDQDLDTQDHFGVSVSLDGTMLAVGAHNDDGVSNGGDDYGAVYLYTFNNTSFENPILAGTIGSGYTDDNSYNQSGLEDNDFFGHGVSLDDNRLAVLAWQDDGLSSDEVSNNGSVYLYTFTDSSFSHDGSPLEAIIGANYSGSKDIDFEPNADSTSVMTSVSLDGTDLALGAFEADGATLNTSGEVYIFSFTDSLFTGGVLEATMGEGRSPTTPYISSWDSDDYRDMNITLRTQDKFGRGVSLDSGRLAVGAYYGDGSSDSLTNTGEVWLFPEYADDGMDNASLFGTNPSVDHTISPSTLVSVLSSGTAVILQASNDIGIFEAVTVDNVDDAGGALTLQAGRSILINANITTDNGNLTLTANDTMANGVKDDQRELGNAAITMSTGATINVGTGIFTATISAGADKTNSASGDITLNNVTAATLNVTNNGATSGSEILDSGTLTISGTSIFTTSASSGHITLNNTSGHLFTRAVSLNTGSSGNATVVDTDGLDLGLSTVGGTLSATAVLGDIVDSDTLTITGLATFTTKADDSDIILDSRDNTFAAAVKMVADDGSEDFENITFVDSAAVDFDASVSANGDLWIDAGTDHQVTGNLSVTAGGNITQNVALAVTGTSSFTTNNSDVTITLSGTNALAGTVSLNTTGSSGNATLDNGTTALDLATSTVGGNLAVTAGNDITDCNGCILTVGGTSSFAADVNDKTITLSENHAFTEAISFTTTDNETGTANDADVSVTGISGTALKLGASTVKGDLTITTSNAGGATNTAISDEGVLTIHGNSTFTSTATDAAIDLDSANLFTGWVTLATATGGDATITTGGQALEFNTSTVGRHLSVTSAAAITQSGVLTVTGTTTITADNSGTKQDVSLEDLTTAGTPDAQNQFSGAVSVTGNWVKLGTANGIILGDITTVDTNGHFTLDPNQSGANTGSVTQAAGTALDIYQKTIITATGIDVLLTSTTNDMTRVAGGQIRVVGTNVEIVDIDNIELGTITATGLLKVTAGGAVTNSSGQGVLTITGATTIEAKSGDTYYAITLDSVDGSSDYDNDFQGAVLLTGSNVEVNDLNDLDLGTSTVTGTYIARSLTGDITDAGALTVTGTSTFVTSGNGETIDLDQGDHAFTGAITITTNDSGSNTGGDVTIIAGSAVALDFGASTIDGDLIVANSNTTGGSTESNAAITDRGVLTVRGTASFQTTGLGANIYLDQSHAVTGKVTLNTTKTALGVGGHATLDNGALDIVLGDGTSGSGATLATSVGGNLTVTSGNSLGITDASGETVTVGGDLSATTDDDNGVINLGTLVVEGTIALATNDDASDDSATALVVNNCSICSGGVGLNFAASTVEGNLTATATKGSMTQSGALTIKGTSTLTTSANNATIDLDTTTNAFAGALTITTNDDSGADADVTIDGGTTKLIIATSTIDGDLTIRTGNAADTSGITDNGTVTVGGNLSVTNDVDDGDINMDTLAVTGSIALTTQASGGNAAVTNDRVLDLAASTVGGTLGVTASAGNITDSGQLTITGAATFTAANNQSIYLDNLDALNNEFGIHTFLSTVSFSSSGAALANVTVRDSTAFDFGAALTLASGGNLIVTSGGNVTQTGGALAIPGTTTISAAGSTVTLSNSSNNFTGAVSIEAHTVDLEDNNVDGLILGASTVTDNYLVTAVRAVTQLVDTALDITGTTTVSASGQNVTLANTSNDFTGAVIITGAAVELVDADTIDLGASTVSGTYAVTAKLGNITQSGNLSVTNASTFKTEGTGADIILNTLAHTNALAGTVKLTTTGSGGDASIDNGTTVLQIAAGTSVGGNLTLVSGNSSGITHAGTLTVGGNLYATTDDNNGVINLGDLDMSATTSKIQLTTHNNGAATVVNTKHLHFISVDVGGNFSATATDGTITQDNAFDIDGTSDFYSVSAGNIILDSAENDFTDDVMFRGGAVVIKDKNDIEFGGGDSTAAATLDGFALKVYAGDRITDDNTIPSNLKVTGGNAWFGTNFGNEPAGSGDDATSQSRIVLDSAGNEWGGTVTLRGGIGYTVNSSSDVVLTAMTLPGDLRVTTTGGTVTDTGVLSVEGLTVISASGFDVTLDGDGTTYNNFQDEVQIVGANVVIKDTNDIELGKSTVSGTYDVTVGGTVTQNQLTANPLVITGATTISGTDITLNNTANNFSRIGVTTIGSDVVLVDTNEIELGASTVTGTYDVTAGGAVTQLGALAITGATTITADSSGTKQNVTLTNASNNFQSSLGVTGSTVRVTDTNDLDLGTTTTTGAYTVIAGGGITDSGALTIGTTASPQTASFTAGDGKAIILNNVNASSQPVHDFSGALTFAASSGNLAGLTVYAVDAIALAGLTLVAAGDGDLAGNLSLQSGAVTQSGAWVIPGTTTISASGTNINLSEGSNDFTGAVSITGNNVTLVDANAIKLGASTVTGNYAVTATAGGGITDSGILNVTGTSTFTAAGGQSIILVESSTFTSAVTFASGGTLVGVSITDTTDFDLKELTLSGNLVVASGGSITQSGSLTIGGTSSFTTSTTNKTITLYDPTLTNAFTGAFTLSSTGENAHVTIDNGTTAIDIASASVGGNLTLTSGAAAGIIDSGPVTVAGNLIAITDANNGIINMVNLAVDGSISLTTNGTGNATIVNDAGLNFATSTIGGDLTATATTLNIIDSGRIKVTGATIITLGTNPVLSVSGATSATDVNGLKITLDTANNLFTGGITLRYDNVLPPDDNSDIYLASQVAFAELLFAIDQNITKIYGSYGEMQDHLLWMYKLFRDSFPRQEQFLEVDRQPQPNQVKLRKIKTNTKKNNGSEGKRL